VAGLIDGRNDSGSRVPRLGCSKLSIAGDDIASITVVREPATKVTEFSAVVRATEGVAEFETDRRVKAEAGIEGVTSGMA
jgi:hypothetical protein